METNTKNQFSKNLAFFMKLKGVDRNTLSKDLNIKYTTICEWLKGNTMPRADKMDLVAKYFNIDSSDLVKKPDELANDFFCPVIDYVPMDMTVDEALKTHIIAGTALLRKNPNQFLIGITKTYDPGNQMPIFDKGAIVVFDRNVSQINEEDMLYIKRKGHHGEIAMNIADTKKIILGITYSIEDNNEPIIFQYLDDDKDIEILGKLVAIIKPAKL